MTHTNPLSRRQFVRASLLSGTAALLATPSRAGESGQALPWRVGIAKAEITPPLEVGILMSTGRRLWQPFEGVRMPLEARALVVERHGLRLAVVSLDLLGLGDEAVGGMTQFKKRIAADSGRTVEADRIVLCSTHTHSAPSSLGVHRSGSDRSVQDVAGRLESADRLRHQRCGRFHAPLPVDGGCGLGGRTRR